MVKYYITKSHSQKIIHYFYCLLQKISHSEFLWKLGLGSKKIFSPVMQFEEKKREGEYASRGHGENLLDLFTVCKEY